MKPRPYGRGVRLVVLAKFFEVIQRLLHKRIFPFAGKVRAPKPFVKRRAPCA